MEQIKLFDELSSDYSIAIRCEKHDFVSITLIDAVHDELIDQNVCRTCGSIRSLITN